MRGAVPLAVEASRVELLRERRPAFFQELQLPAAAAGAQLGRPTFELFLAGGVSQLFLPAARRPTF